MGWLDRWINWTNGQPLDTPVDRDMGLAASQARMAAKVSTPASTLKTGEQVAKMTDPQGKRLYHEYFVGDDRGDGHFPWQCRVYSGAHLAAEKNGLAASFAVAKQQALAWAESIRNAMSEAP